jgi:hypothetical protein
MQVPNVVKHQLTATSCKRQTLSKERRAAKAKQAEVAGADVLFRVGDDILEVVNGISVVRTMMSWQSSRISRRRARSGGDLGSYCAAKVPKNPKPWPSSIWPLFRRYSCMEPTPG